MEELIKLVQEKTGLGEDQAKGAVETVIGFMKEKLPEPIAGQLDNLLKSDADIGGMLNQAQGMMGQLGGLFGKKD